MVRILIIMYFFGLLSTVSTQETTCTTIGPLGMENGFIKDSQITASSTYDDTDGGFYPPKDARLRHTNFWATSTPNPSNPLIQVDFRDTGNEVCITGIQTQGSSLDMPLYQNWVSKLRIQTGNSIQSLAYIMEGNEPKIFDANIDRDSIANIEFPETICARFLRILPTEWMERVALRFEVIGCQTEISLLQNLISQSGTAFNGSSDRAVDGNINGNFQLGSCSHTGHISDQPGPWWKVDIVESQCVGRVVIYNRNDCCGHYLTDAIVRVGDDDVIYNNPVFGRFPIVGEIMKLTCGLQGRYISVNNRPGSFPLCEIKAYHGNCSVESISDIRLQNSPNETPNAGRLQVYYSNRWHDVCSDGNDDLGNQDWRFNEAMVACRQLGYPGTALTDRGRFGTGPGPAITNLYCDGDEKTLDDCTCIVEKEKCSHGDQVELICTAPGYQGCFTNAQMEQKLSDAQMTVTKCLQFCRKSASIFDSVVTFAGLQSSTTCICGDGGDDNAGYGSRVSDNECNLLCGGNDFEICGGEEHISVYDLSLGVCEEPTIEHGGTPENDFSFGMWVTFECDGDYELHGNNKLQCVIGNTPNDCRWSGDVPSCQIISTTTTDSASSDLLTKVIAGSSTGIFLLGVVVIILVIYVCARKRREIGNATGDNKQDERTITRSDGNTSPAEYIDLNQGIYTNPDVEDAVNPDYPAYQYALDIQTEDKNLRRMPIPTPVI